MPYNTLEKRRAYARKRYKLNVPKIKKWKEDNKEKLKTYFKDYHKKHVDDLHYRAKKIVNACYNRSFRFGEFDLTIDWLEEKLRFGKCELTGLEFKFRDKLQNFWPSIDRIDNTKGYLKNNCRVVLYCVNAFKGTMTEEDFKIVVKALVTNI